MKKYLITGTVGAGYKETAYFNPRELVWETGSMNMSRYDIETIEKAEDLLNSAKQDIDVFNIEIETLEIDKE